MFCLGIEGTAHTFGIGIFKELSVTDSRDVYKPEKGGIHPIEAAEHHKAVKEKVLQDALSKASIRLSEIDLIAYSAGPGLPPCLRVTRDFAQKLAKEIKKPLIEVNHCISHVEIGKFLTDAKDPITLYVSGGNTQIIGFASGRYRVFGETQDIAIGNAIDTFIRKTHPQQSPGGFGGKYFDDLASKGKYIELPYVVKGMDLSFSGILTAALQQYEKGEKLEDICHSMQETCYAMLTEVTERALAHTGKSEVLLTGGVAASQRLQEMLGIMCKERDARFYVVPREFAGDNGSMIAYTGMIAYLNGQAPVENPDFHQKWRTDEVEVTWIK